MGIPVLLVRHLHFLIRFSDPRTGAEQEIVAGPPANDGTRDIGTSPCPMLLMRGLDSLTTKAEIGDALTKMFEAVRKSEPSTSKSTIPPDSTIKRVLLIKDRSSTASLCFAFAEFTTTQVSLSLFVQKLLDCD